MHMQNVPGDPLEEEAEALQEDGVIFLIESNRNRNHISVSNFVD